MPDQWTREIDCRDRAGRNRKLGIFIGDGDEVVVVAPPGEAALVDPQHINDIKQALTDAQLEALKRRGAW